MWTKYIVVCVRRDSFNVPDFREIIDGGKGTGMTEKEMKKLNRYQLLELLIHQTQRADQLQQQLDEAEERLKAQSVRLASLGSIAEAALQLNGVFEAAQKAADQYLEASRERAEKLEEAAHRQAVAIIREAELKARSISAPKPSEN